MTIQAIRISKTSLKPVKLYGPIDQALKTLIQAEAVKVHPLTLSLHEATLEVELWINAEELSLDGEGTLAERLGGKDFNVPATAILGRHVAKQQGVLDQIENAETPEEMMGFAIQLADSSTLVQGPAILLGAGGADLPTDELHMGCLAEALFAG